MCKTFSGIGLQLPLVAGRSPYILRRRSQLDGLVWYDSTVSFRLRGVPLFLSPTSLIMSFHGFYPGSEPDETIYVDDEHQGMPSLPLGLLRSFADRVDVFDSPPSRIGNGHAHHSHGLARSSPCRMPQVVEE
jgi:hypothetical protein